MTDTPSALGMAAQLLRQHADSIAEGRPADPAILRAVARTIEEHQQAEPAPIGDGLLAEWLHQLSEQHTITHRETATLREALGLFADGTAHTGTTVQLDGPSLVAVASKAGAELERRADLYEQLGTAREFYAGTVLTLSRSAQVCRDLVATGNAHR